MRGLSLNVSFSNIASTYITLSFSFFFFFSSLPFSSKHIFAFCVLIFASSRIKFVHVIRIIRLYFSKKRFTLKDLRYVHVPKTFAAATLSPDMFEIIN